MTVYIANSFSLGMLSGEQQVWNLRVVRINKEEVKKWLQDKDFVSCIGHESTAKFLSKVLDIEIPYNRVQIKLKKGDVVIVAQIMQRLSEGKILSEDEIEKAPVKWFLVIVY